MKPTLNKPSGNSYEAKRNTPIRKKHFEVLTNIHRHFRPSLVQQKNRRKKKLYLKKISCNKHRVPTGLLFLFYSNLSSSSMLFPLHHTYLITSPSSLILESEFSDASLFSPSHSHRLDYRPNWDGVFSHFIYPQRDSLMIRFVSSAR